MAVHPGHHARRGRAASRAAHRPGSGGPAPGGRGPLTRVSSGWWLNSITGRSAQAVSSPCSQPSWVASSEPCQPPCGLTVSSLCSAPGRGRTRSRRCPRRRCAGCSRARPACPGCGSARGRGPDLVTGARPGSGVTASLVLPAQLGQRVRVRRVEPADGARAVQAGRRGDVLDPADRKPGHPLLRPDRALQHVVVVAVHRVPGHAQARGAERAPERRRARRARTGTP